MKTTANRLIAIASITVIVAFLVTYDRDYRWVGHLVAGLVVIGFLAGTVIYGLSLAGRLRRPPGAGRFSLHRKVGIVLGILVIAAFFYGLWVMMPQGKRLMDTAHGWLGLGMVLLSIFQVIPSLTVKRRKFIRPLHRWAGYLLAGLIIPQIILGVFMLATPTEGRRYLVRGFTPMEEAWRPDGTISPKEYFIERVLDSGNYAISYRTDGKYFYVGLKVKTTGWVGVGVEAEGMQNSDMIFGYVSAGKVTINDSFGVSKYKHRPDTELGGTDDILEFGGKEEEEFTIIEFKRQLSTGDNYDIPLVEGIHKIIWAYSPDDNEGMHVTQGHIEIELKAR